MIECKMDKIQALRVQMLEWIGDLEGENEAEEIVIIVNDSISQYILNNGTLPKRFIVQTYHTCIAIWATSIWNVINALSLISLHPKCVKKTRAPARQTDWQKQRERKKGQEDGVAQA